METNKKQQSLIEIASFNFLASLINGNRQDFVHKFCYSSDF